MMSLWYNRWTVMGRLVKDPGPPRFLPTGDAQLEFSIACSRPLSGKGHTGQTEHVSYFEVIVRGRQAEVCSERLRKGAPVFVEGEARQLSYPAIGNTPPKKRIVLFARRGEFLAAGVDMPAGEDASGVEIPE